MAHGLACCLNLGTKYMSYVVILLAHIKVWGKKVKYGPWPCVMAHGGWAWMLCHNVWTMEDGHDILGHGPWRAMEVKDGP